MKNKLFALCCVVWIVSCCEIQDKDFSVGQLHNMALSEIVTKVVSDSVSTAYSSLLDRAVSYLESKVSYGGRGQSRNQMVALSDSARSLYHQLNHILIHQSQVEQTADTLFARIAQWQTRVSSDTYISEDEIELLVSTGDVAYNSLLFWTDTENQRQIDEIRQLIQSQEPMRNRQISGRVFDEYGEPIIGASVVVYGTNIGTITDYNGNFTIVVPDVSPVYLDISFIGFKTTQLRVGSASNISHIVLSEDYDIITSPSSSSSSSFLSDLHKIGVIVAHDALAYYGSKNPAMAAAASLLAGAVL